MMDISKLLSGQSALGLALLLLAGLAYKLGLPGEYAAGLGMLGTLLIKAEFRLAPTSRGDEKTGGPDVPFSGPAQRDREIPDSGKSGRGGA